jgi:glutaredoxin
MHTPELELLWWEGCPSTERALSDLREVLSELSLERAEIHMREIRTHDEAIRAGFIGSPTILIDGQDVIPSAIQDEDAMGLTCRVYRRCDGTVSPTPDPDDLRDALRRAAARVEVAR